MRPPTYANPSATTAKSVTNTIAMRTKVKAITGVPLYIPWLARRIRTWPGCPRITDMMGTPNITWVPTRHVAQIMMICRMSKNATSKMGADAKGICTGCQGSFTPLYQ